MDARFEEDYEQMYKLNPEVCLWPENQLRT